MTDKNKTEIVVVLDRSGSMAGIASDMRGGFDTFIAEQKKIPGECSVSLIQFDDHYEVVYQGKPIEAVPPLKLDPRGSTALLDAIGRTINDTGVRLAKLPEALRPGKVAVVIITDGHENASREYTKAQIETMINVQRGTFAWEFFFLGAQQDAIAVAKSYGIPQGRAACYQDAKAAYSGISANVGAMRSGGQLRDQQDLTNEAEQKSR